MIREVVMEITKEYSNSKIRKKIFSMILPITVESVLQMIVGFVSMAMIGRISAIAVGALGLSMRITQIVWALFKGVTTGATVFVAQAHGAQNNKKLRQVVQQTLLSTIILVILLQILIFWKAPDLILNLFHPKEDLLQSAVTYLRTVSWGLPFMAIMLVVAGVLQGTGNAITPMLITLFMNIINAGLSFIFIFGKLGMPAMGIRGAALATIIAQFMGAMVGLYVLFSKGGILNSLFNKKLFDLDIRQIGDIYRVGMPTAFESIFWQIAALIITNVILSFGEIPLAAHQLGLQAESISYMPAAGFGIAATTFVGQALGAKDKKLGKAYLKETLKGAIIVTLFCASLLVFFPQLIMKILTDDVEVIKLGAKYLIIMGLVQMPQNVSGVLNGALRGAGYTKVPMIVAGIGLWGVRIPLSLLFTYYFHMNIIAIWLVMGADLIVRFILSFTVYKTKNIFEKSFVLEEVEA